MVKRYVMTEYPHECYMEQDDAGPYVLYEDYAALQAENERLKEKIGVTIGVGSGGGNSFVHGDYDSIKVLQAKLLEMERLRSENERLTEELRKVNSGETVRVRFDLSPAAKEGAVCDHLVSSGSAVAAISDALREASNGWIRAVDHELVVAGIGIADLNDSVDEAARKLSLLIDWHVAVATDPAVNGGYVLVPVEASEKEIEAIRQMTVRLHTGALCRLRNRI